MKNRILFINPPQTCLKEAKYTSFKFPLGFLYMADYLRKNNFNIKILDCPLYYRKRRAKEENSVQIGLFPEDIKKTIKNFKPDIIGISCAYSAYESDSFEAIDLVREVEKEIKKKILVVVGGAHSSANPEYVLRNNKIDLLVIGEGEETILEIAEKYKKNSKIDNIRGTAIRKNKKIKINKPREFIQKLDNLKPAWDLLDTELYFKHPDNSRVTLRGPSIDIITSRGCPANCVFCSIHTVWGRKWRGRSPKNVVDEIEHLIKTYHIKHFRVQDDNLTLDKKRIIEICSQIIKRKLDIKWDTPNGVAIWTLDKHVLKKMKQAGCYRITFGIESGCKKSQKYIRKIIDIEKINNMIDFCHKIGMWVCSTFIIGFPYETKEDIDQTKSFLLNSKINFPFIYVAQPYPGTDMYEDFKKEGLLKNIQNTSNLAESRYDTLFFTKQELNTLRNKIYKKFYIKKIKRYINPVVFYKEFLSKIKNSEDVKYILINFGNVFKGV